MRGEFELLFGVSSLDDPAAAAVEQLKGEFPERAIRLVVCPERLGTNGKVSTLTQLAAHARYDFLLINDSDITVTPRYLERVMSCFGATNSRRRQSADSGGVGDGAVSRAGAWHAVGHGLRRWGLLRTLCREFCCRS